VKRSYVFVVAAMLVLLLWSGCEIITQSTDTSDDGSAVQSEDITAEADTEGNSQEAYLESSENQEIHSENSEVVVMFLDTPILVRLSNDNKTTEIKITNTDDLLTFYSQDDESKYSIYLIDVSIGYFVNSYYVKSFDGYPFFVVSYDYCSDDYETKVMNFSNSEPKEIFSLPLYVVQIDENGFEAYGYLQSAGTWAVNTHAYFVNDGIEWRGTYVLDQKADSYTKVQTVMELPVQMLTNGIYTDSALPPGTTLSFTETDGKSYMSFLLNDGAEGKISFTWDDDWIEVIDGIPIYEYFNNLPQFG